MRGGEITLIYAHTPALTGRRLGTILQVEVNVGKRWIGVASSVKHPDVNIVLLEDGAAKETKDLLATARLSFQLCPCAQVRMHQTRSPTPSRRNRSETYESSSMRVR